MRRAFVVVVLLAGGVCAQDDKVRQQFETKRRETAKKTAAARVEAAEWCYSKKLYEVAVIEYELALKLDPDNAKARERLGYKKVNGVWEEKPSGQAKRKNECPKDEVNNLNSTYLERIKKPYEKAANDWYETGKWAKERKLDAEAEAAFREAIGFVADHAKAREALGYTREGDKWVSPEDRAAADAMKKQVEAAEEGEEVKEETPEEKAIGVPLAKRKTKHFLIQSSLGDANAKECAKLAETVFTEFHAFVEVPVDTPVVQEPIGGVLLLNEAQHRSYVDNFVEGSDGLKDFYRKGGGQWNPSPPRFEGWKTGDDAGIADMVVHMSVHVLFHYYMGAGANNVAPWLYESMGYTFSVRLRRTALTHCITSGTGGGGKEGMPYDAGRWKEATRASVQKGVDPPMSRMLGATINSIQGDLLLKGWSMLDWMVATRKPKLLAFFEALKQAPEGVDGQIAAWKSAFGQTPEESEKEWRAWVQANY